MRGGGSKTRSRTQCVVSDRVRSRRSVGWQLREWLADWLAVVVCRSNTDASFVRGKGRDIRSISTLTPAMMAPRQDACDLATRQPGHRPYSKQAWHRAQKPCKAMAQVPRLACRPGSAPHVTVAIVKYRVPCRPSLKHRSQDQAATRAGFLSLQATKMQW